MATTEAIEPVVHEAKPQSTDQPPQSPLGEGLGLSTLAVHAGEARQKPGDAVTDAIFCSSTYTFTDTQSIIDFIEQEQPREEYGRYGNPGEKVVEAKLAALEGAEARGAVLQRHGALWSGC